MDEKRQEEQKDEEKKDEQQAEESDLDVEGHHRKGNRSGDDEDDEGTERGEEKGKFLSDARLKRDVKTIEDARGRLTRIGS